MAKTETTKIINIAVIAHVDAGKSTLVDAFLMQSGVFRANEEVVDCVMDSDDIERERGITIYSKNCSVQYEDYKINIVDTPGHADFSSEVERIIKTVDTVILLVDSSEGPMPQTRFVLQKSLEQGLNPILLINKIDKRDARVDEVVDMVYQLFMDLNANNAQLDFPILYGVVRDGVVRREPEDENNDIIPLFETIIHHVPPYPDRNGEPLQLQISTLAYDDYIGRLGIGRVTRGTIREAQPVSVVKANGDDDEKTKINQIFTYIGMKRIVAAEAGSGDIVVVSGIPDISIGDTVCDPDAPEGAGEIKIEEPTMSMTFLVNKSPFAGKSGKYVTSRHLKERLRKETEVNVGLLVEETEATDSFKVSGRGELHLSVLIENMRREGYEMAVSKPEVIMKRDHGQLLEPIERVILSLPDAYAGTAISKMNIRKGIMLEMASENGFARIEYLVPTRGLMGYRSEFINDTRGEGTLVRRFESFEAYKGEIPQRTGGVIVSGFAGETSAYALNNIGERAALFVGSGVPVYEGMIIGMNSRNTDMVVNPAKTKKKTNMRAAGSDENIKLPPPVVMTLEESLEFINDDELVEVVPDDIRIRKKYLTELERRRGGK
jgi:GTP-binding protein